MGLALLLPAYAIGGMGAGDVKLLAGVGAWVGVTDTLYAFCVSAIVGGVIAVLMVLYRRAWSKHYYQFWMIWHEVATIRDPEATLDDRGRAARARCCCSLWNSHRHRHDRLFCIHRTAAVTAQSFPSVTDSADKSFGNRD